MTYTQQLRELLNELKLAKGKNCLIFAISERPARLEELIEPDGFDVREISLKGKDNLLEMLLTWNETTENTIYVVHGIGNQFPWVLPYINLHRDLFFDIKRPVVVVGSEYEIMEIQKHAPDWFRFRSRTYELKEEELGEERVITRLAESTEPKPVYYSLPVFVEEECEEETKEQIKIDEYLLSSEHDDYKLAELYMSLSLSYFKLRDFERGEEYLQKSKDIREKLKDNKGISLNYARLSSIFVGISEYEKAIDACNEALKIDSDFAGVYIIRGVANDELKQYERAIEDYGKAIALNPDVAETYHNRGIAYAGLKKHERAIEDYGKAITLNPDVAETYYSRGKAYAGLKKHERAIEDYNKAIELNPNYAEAYNNRGNAYVRLNKHERAIEDYNKAIELNPDYAAAYNNRGGAYYGLKKHERAIEDCNKAIELNPDDAAAYYNRGNAYYGLKKHEQAIEDYSKVITLNPDYAGTYYSRGNAYVRLNKHERAIEDYNKAIELNPDDAAAYNNRGNVYVELNRHERAIEDYNKAIELNPNYALFYNNRGTAYILLNKHELAIEDYSKAIALNPDDAAAYNNRGNVYDELKKRELAIEDYSKAIALNPNDAAAYRNRGKAQSEIGRYEESTRDFKKAGILFFDSGSEEDTVKSFSFCFDLQPKIENDDVIYSGLALFLMTKDANIKDELRRMQIEDETLRKIFSLTLMKLRDENISEGIAMLEEKEQTEEKKILFELLKRL